MKNIPYIVILIGILSCKEEPNYNPFDDQFHVSVKTLVHHNCDTISAGCGYYNLATNKGKLRTYYQVHNKDFYTVVAKGLAYSEDSVEVSNSDRFFIDSFRVDSVVNLPINEKVLNMELASFGYQIESRMNDRIRIVNKESKDTINLKMTITPVHNSQYVKREIGYFKSY